MPPERGVEDRPPPVLVINVDFGGIGEHRGLDCSEVPSAARLMNHGLAHGISLEKRNLSPGRDKSQEHQRGEQ